MRTPVQVGMDQCADLRLDPVPRIVCSRVVCNGVVGYRNNMLPRRYVTETICNAAVREWLHDTPDITDDTEV